MARTISIGCQDFETLRKENYFYIDKTFFLSEWWEEGDSVTLITRPRRFGKTLNMSMTEQFFSVKYAGRVELFEGLSIWNNEKYRNLQGEAIARNLYEMSSLKIPVLSVIIGEGGSGGALAMAVADEVWMLENSVYSVLSPEGFASILWKDSTKAKEAAGVMKLTAGHLHQMGMVEKVFTEPDCYTAETLSEVTIPLEQEIQRFIEEYTSRSGEELAVHRYNRFRRL